MTRLFRIELRVISNMVHSIGLYKLYCTSYTTLFNVHGESTHLISENPDYQKSNNLHIFRVHPGGESTLLQVLVLILNHDFAVDKFLSRFEQEHSFAGRFYLIAASLLFITTLTEEVTLKFSSFSPSNTAN